MGRYCLIQVSKNYLSQAIRMETYLNTHTLGILLRQIEMRQKTFSVKIQRFLLRAALIIGEIRTKKKEKMVIHCSLHMILSLILQLVWVKQVLTIMKKRSIVMQS